VAIQEISARIGRTTAHGIAGNLRQHYPNWLLQCIVPQLRKCWRTGQSDDLPLRMLLVLWLGVALWIVYGVLKADWIIIACADTEHPP
jgi:hypothetical protein